MKAGTLYHRIDIERRTTTPDAFGEPAHTWTTLHANLPAAVEPFGARELMMAGAAQSDATYRVNLRYIAGVTVADRVAFNGSYLDIRSVRNVRERNTELELLCADAGTGE